MPERVRPFSAELPASPEMFFGYSGSSLRPLPGGWKLEDIAGCWYQSADAAPSFWAVGERKLGKTSLLLRLENLLSASQHRPASARFPVPLYLSCREAATLSDFYRQLLDRAVGILGVMEGAPTESLDVGALTLLRSGRDAQFGPFELFDRAIEDLGTLVAQLSPQGSPRARLVLLIDDIGAAVERGWGAALFEHLRALLRGRPLPSAEELLRREDVAAIIAGERSLERAENARSLLELLEELPLHTLDASEVATLIGDRFKKLRRQQFWPLRIYKATAGHPWLVHFVMENVAAAPGGDGQEHEPDLDAIVKTRFRTLKDGVSTFRLYLDSLSDRSIEILADLAMDSGTGSTLEALAAKTGLSASAVKKRLEQMLNLGIVYHTPGDTPQGHSRYFLGDIFKNWFLAHTGNAVLLAEIERLRADVQREQTRMQVLNAPFTLTLGLNPDFLLADGLSTRLLELDAEFPQHLRAIKTLTRAEVAKDVLDIVADHVRKALQQSKWETVWNDYVDHAKAQDQNARFVLRVGDMDLFQFPVEILAFNGQPLALERPVYKELMAGQRKPAYRLCSNLLPSETELNILLVGSSRGGMVDEIKYPPLPYVEREIAEISRILLNEVAGRRLKVGRIVALVDPAVDLPKRVEKLPLVSPTVTKALRGELGLAFHLLHYCGHYIHNQQQSAGGFLLHDGQDLKLLNLAEWQHALEQTSLRLVCLSACGSAGHVHDANLYHLGAAREAITAGVPVVIGMRWSIRDSQAYDFSSAFYPHLLESGVPEVALLETRRALLAKETGSSLWAAPVMLTR